jgi:3-dehydroquinate synthase
VRRSRIAARRGLLDWRTLDRLIGLLAAVGLPVVLDDLPVPLDVTATIGALWQIRKIRDGVLRFVLPAALGETVIADDVTEAEIRAAITADATGYRRLRTG